MTGNVVFLRNSMDIPNTLRSIADGIDSGEYSNTTATLILGSDVFALGATVSDEAASCRTVFDCSYAITLLTSASVERTR